MRHQLAWSQERHEDKAEVRLHQDGTCIARFERMLHKGQSLTVATQVPPPPLSWILWHQVRLLALEDEAAFLHTALPMDELNWPTSRPESLPGWMQNAIPSTSSTYRIPE